MTLSFSMMYAPPIPPHLYLSNKTFSHVHQWVTNWTGTLLLSLSPSSTQCHHLHQFFHYGTPHQNHKKQCGNQRGGLVWAVSLQLLLMSCNLEQREAMPAQGNCCCLVHSLANGGGGGIRSSVLISKRTKEAEGDSVKDDLRALPT